MDTLLILDEAPYVICCLYLDGSDVNESIRTILHTYLQIQLLRWRLGTVEKGPITLDKILSTCGINY